MKKFYKTYTESHEGNPGHFYCEVENGSITRQINEFDGVYFWATPEAHFDEQYDFTGNPEFSTSDGGAKEISEADFLSLWITAINQTAR